MCTAQWPPGVSQLLGMHPGRLYRGRNAVSAVGDVRQSFRCQQTTFRGLVPAPGACLISGVARGRVLGGILRVAAAVALVR